MIDLTNKSIDEINGLIQKYASVLELIHQREQIPYLAYIIDIAVNHIKEKHNYLSIDWKAWSVVVIKKLFLDKKINNESDIIKSIDDFIEYQKNEYQNYLNDLAMFTSEYDRDLGFVWGYVCKKNR